MVFYKITRQRIAYLAGCFVFGAILFVSSSAQAASLHFSPSSGDVTVGNIINVSVVVNTQGVPINNAEATINFPTSLLEVVSITKTGSIFSLWVEEPSFSNISGNISFNGGVPSPGYNGATGRLLNIAFRVKSAGTASLLFASGSVRANDGLGTDVLSALGGASFSVSPAQPAPKPVEPKPVVVPVVEPEVTPDPGFDIVPIEKPIESPAPAPRVTFEKSWPEKAWDRLASVPLTTLVLVILVIALSASLLLLLYGRRRFVHLRSKMRRDAHDVEKVLQKSFRVINEDIAACVDLFERANVRRRLTEEEKAVINLLKQHLRNTERLVAKEIHDIRREAEE